MALHWPPSTTPLQPFFDFCVQSYSASHLYLSHIMYSFCHSNPWIKLLFWFINSSSISSTLHSPCSFPLPLSSQILFIINFLGNLFDALTSSIHLHYPLHLVNAQPLTTTLITSMHCVHQVLIFVSLLHTVGCTYSHFLIIFNATIFIHTQPLLLYHC